MTGKVTTAFIAAIFASQAALTAVSFADGKKGKGRTTVINLKAKLAFVSSGTPLPADLIGVCEGQAKYENKTTTKGNPPTTSTEETFTGGVECPVFDFAVGPTDVYDMHLARGGADYAVCSLVIKEIEFDYDKSNPMVPAGMKGEYAVNVSQKTEGTPPVSTLKQKVGGCMDPGFVSELVPAVQTGDTATVFLNGGSTPLLTGTFGLSSSDD